jgi:hypothetical protein
MPDKYRDCHLQACYFNNPLLMHYPLNNLGKTTSIITDTVGILFSNHFLSKYVKRSNVNKQNKKLALSDTLQIAYDTLLTFDKF